MSHPMVEKVSVGDTEVCPACNHGVSWHFNDVTGVARCLVVHRGETTSGIIGLPWERRCPCANFQVPEQPEPERPRLSEGLKQVLRDALKKVQENEKS